MELENEPRYTITPKGILWTQLMKAINEMVLEQRNEFINHLEQAVNYMKRKRDFAAAGEIADSLIMTGFDGFGDAEDRR
jgi:hypothetical protein